MYAPFHKKGGTTEKSLVTKIHVELNACAWESFNKAKYKSFGKKKPKNHHVIKFLLLLKDTDMLENKVYR